MSYKIEIQSFYFVVTDTATSEEIIREPRANVKWKRDTANSVYFFYSNIATLTGEQQGSLILGTVGDETVPTAPVQSFAFADIVDVDGFAFPTEDDLATFLDFYTGGLCCDSVMISQTITDGVTNKAPSEDAVHDALELKLDITALPSNLVLYFTSTNSDIVPYKKLVTSISDPDYDEPEVIGTTPAITSIGQALGSHATIGGILTGNPGIVNVSVIGYFRRVSGTGSASYFFRMYHRDSGGTETLIATSSSSPPVTSASFVEVYVNAQFNNGDWNSTDRIVIKIVADRIPGGSDPVYEVRFGGDLPSRTIVPVPASTLLDIPIQIGVTEVVDGTTYHNLMNVGGVIQETDYAIPKVDGTNGQVIVTNGAGVASWGNPLPQVQSVTSSATVTATASDNLVKITAQAAALLLGNPSGTFAEGQALMYRIKDDGTARAITYDTKFRAVGVTLPTTTVISKTTYLGVIYNSTDDKYDVIGVTTEA